MIKLLIAGSKNAFCDQLKEVIIAQKCNAKIVAIATTEEELLQKIEKNSPDLVLCDVKLSTGSSFGVIKKILKKGSKVRFAIVTEHRNFEHAREAVNLGIEKFLMMPVTNKAIVKLIQEVDEKVTLEKETEQKLKEHNLWKRERVLAALSVDKNLIPQNLKKYCEEIKHSLSKSPYVLFLIQTKNIEFVRNRLENIFEEESNYIGSFVGLNIVVGIQRFHSGASETRIRSSLKSFFGRFCELCNREKGNSIYVSISSILKSDADISVGFKECLTTQKLDFLYDDSSVPFYNDIAFLSESIAVPTLYNKKTMENMLVNEETTNMRRFFRALLNEIKKNRIYNTENIIDMYRNIAMDIIATRIHHSGDVIDVQKTLEKLMKAEKLIELNNQIEAYAISTVKVLHEIKIQKSLTPVNKAIYYIEQNYSRSDINLQGVSEFVGLAPAYFSRLFKKEVGCSFIQFLMEKRTEKAKNLLVNTNMKIYEVCTDVGYTDTRYFIKMFKNITGETPMQFKRGQYRKSNLDE